jgi:hypothetical protein
MKCESAFYPEKKFVLGVGDQGHGKADYHLSEEADGATDHGSVEVFGRT